MNSVIIEKIRQLQIQEGHKPCFKCNKLICLYGEVCCWADLCLERYRVKPLIKWEVVE